MKKLTLILFLAIAKIGFAQQDTTLIYNSPMYLKDPVRSKWRPVVKREGELYQVSFYDKKDVLKEVISFEDKNLTIRKGPYSSYYGTTIGDNGSYDKGHKHGEWINYSVVNGERQVRRIQNYYYGKLNGKYVEYWNGNKEEGNYTNGEKTGNWIFTYEDGKLAGEEVYSETGKKSKARYYNRDGIAVKYEDLFAPPGYKGGLKEFYRYLWLLKLIIQNGLQKTKLWAQFMLVLP